MGTSDAGGLPDADGTTHKPCHVELKNFTATIKSYDSRGMVYRRASLKAPLPPDA
jgi:hypothetical protein